MSSSSSARSGDSQAEASSSRQVYTQQDEGPDANVPLDTDVLASDPLNGSLPEG